MTSPRQDPPPKIVRRVVEFACPWFEVERKDVSLGGRPAEPYFTVKTEPYLAVLAMLDDGRIPLVRQYRPAVEATCLELPSGRVEPGETIEAAGIRELFEETGCRASEVERLGVVYTDTGRMQTRQVGLVARDATRVARPAPPDEDLEVLLVDPSELRSLVMDGCLATGAHVSLIAVAWTKGVLPF